MNEKIIDSGKTKYAWAKYLTITDDKQKNIQVVEWPNGEGFSVMRDNDSCIEFEWCEWEALTLAVNSVK